MTCPQHAEYVVCLTCGDKWPRAGLWERMFPTVTEVVMCDSCICSSLQGPAGPEHSDGSECAT